MDEKNTTKITSEDLRRAFEGDAAAKPAAQHNPVDNKPSHKPLKKKLMIFNIVGGISLAAGVICLLLAFLVFAPNKSGVEYPEIPSKTSSDNVYSMLTGEILADKSQVTAPAYCVQMPNGTDGARPQAGLNQAGVVFEAIAEAGITRFAAVYQNPDSTIIGPVRSLRIYYLQWDTPFDCTIVHAGGSGDALAAVSSGGYKDLSEDYNYMYRGTYGGRLWNNLFTTTEELKQFSVDHNDDSSDIKGFARLTPAESEQQRADKSVKEKLDITKATTENTSAVDVPVPSVALNLGGWADFNVNYNYDAETNTYLRSYESGNVHQVYNCTDGGLDNRNPEDVCTLGQVAPAVVVAMMVQESRAADNYHEDITAIGSGKAYIFQNGTAIEANWNKASAEDQIKFTDSGGKEVKLAPGQTFITAVPNYGSVDF